MWGKTFDSFRQSQGMTTAFNAVQRLLSPRRGFPQLLLMGNYGVGKTHLAYAACNHCRVNNWPYKFIRAVDLMRQLRDAIKQSREDSGAMTPEMWIGAYAGNFLLCLDDYGAHQATDYASASLFDILDARYALQHPTIITTNCGMKQIDPRLASRWQAGIVACAGPDMRAKVDA